MARILLVDDDTSVRTILRLTLSHFGHHVTEAADGKSALKLFDSGIYDLVLTDIVMPDSDGLELLIGLHKRPQPPRIIAMSGGGRVSAHDHLKTAKMLGATRVLEKPFTNEVLIRTIHELLEPVSRDADPDKPDGEEIVR